jgi:hypothetical protein
MPEGINGDASYFRIFSTDIVLCDQRLHAVAQRFFRRALSGDSGQSLSLSASTGFQTSKFREAGARPGLLSLRAF